MTRETDERVTEAEGRNRPAPLPRNESPEFYEGLGRAIKVARTARGTQRKELADAGGRLVRVPFRHRDGPRATRVAIVPRDRRGLALSPSTLMREAESYRARIGGEEAPGSRSAPTPGSSPRDEIQARMARMSEAAPSATARRWFHAGRLLAEAERDLVLEETEEHLGGLGEVGRCRRDLARSCIGWWMSCRRRT